MSPNHFSLT